MRKLLSTLGIIAVTSVTAQTYKFNKYIINNKQTVLDKGVYPKGISVTLTSDSCFFSNNIMSFTSQTRFKIEKSMSGMIGHTDVSATRILLVSGYKVIQLTISDCIDGTQVQSHEDLKNAKYIKCLTINY